MKHRRIRSDPRAEHTMTSLLDIDLVTTTAPCSAPDIYERDQEGVGGGGEYQAEGSDHRPIVGNETLVATEKKKRSSIRSLVRKLSLRKSKVTQNKKMQKYFQIE